MRPDLAWRRGSDRAAMIVVCQRGGFRHRRVRNRVERGRGKLMGKGGYRGGSTVIGPRDAGWFSKQRRAEPHKDPRRMSPEKRRHRIAVVENLTESLRTQLDHAMAELRSLREVEREAAAVAAKRPPMRSQAPDPKITRRTLSSLEQEIATLFGGSDQSTKRGEG